MNRDEAWQLMTEWVGSESLRHHMQAVEAAMRAYARRFGATKTNGALPASYTISTMKTPRYDRCRRPPVHRVTRLA